MIYIDLNKSYPTSMATIHTGKLNVYMWNPPDHWSYGNPQTLICITSTKEKAIHHILSNLVNQKEANEEYMKDNGDVQKARDRRQQKLVKSIRHTPYISREGPWTDDLCTLLSKPYTIYPQDDDKEPTIVKTTFILKNYLEATDPTIIPFVSGTVIGISALER